MKFRSSLRAFPDYTVLIGSVAAISLTFLITPASATDCPEQAKACKVITLTPEEEQYLVKPGGLLDTAAQARQLDLARIAIYFVNKIAQAEAGTVKAPAADAPKDVPVPTPDPRK